MEVRSGGSVLRIRSSATHCSAALKEAAQEGPLSALHAPERETHQCTGQCLLAIAPAVLAEPLCQNMCDNCKTVH